MKISKIIIYTVILMFGVQVSAVTQQQMQHGFILSNNDQLGSHLVAHGHHSRQTEVLGRLTIQNPSEHEFYQLRKRNSAINQTYFLFQAQKLDLPSLKVGQVLAGHIVESRIGSYEPKNIIVKSATFQIQRVLLNISNPFFTGQTHHSLQNSSNSTLQKSKRPHCCDNPRAWPCDWVKC